MRTRRGIAALFPTVRRGLLATLVLHPHRWWYATELSRQLHLPKTSLQRELVHLVAAGILRKRTEGRQVYYQADPGNPFLPDLQGLMAKTAGLVDVLHEALSPHANGIEFAFVFGSIARADQLAGSDVDLMVVGSVGFKDLVLALRDARERLAREINLTAFSRDEFARKARSGHAFVASVIEQPRLFVVGTASDLEQIVEGRPSGAASGRTTGAGAPSRARAAKPRRRAT
jgi:predicted nucleotidyltransferase